MEIILFHVCDVLSSFFATGFAPLCLRAIGAAQFGGGYRIPFFRKLAAEPVAMGPFPHRLPFVQIH